MSSINAENVAKEVLETIRNEKKVVFGKIIKKNGYALTTSTVPSLVTNTKTYKRVVKPLVEQLEEERQAIMDRLKVTRNKAKYRDLMDGLDKITKTHQLLTGGSTSNIAVMPITNVFNVQDSNKHREDSETKKQN